MGNHSWTYHWQQMVGGALYLWPHPFIYCPALVDAELKASLEYNPFTQEWAVQRSDGDVTGLAAKLQAAKV